MIAQQMSENRWHICTYGTTYEMCLLCKKLSVLVMIKFKPFKMDKSEIYMLLIVTAIFISPIFMQNLEWWFCTHPGKIVSETENREKSDSLYLFIDETPLYFGTTYFAWLCQLNRISRQRKCNSERLWVAWLRSNH